MTSGFALSAVVLLASVVVAFTLIPRHIRETQAGLDTYAGPPSELQPETVGQ